MTRRILREIQLDKIAAVDFPCQEHALVTIMKRDPDAGKIRKTHLADRIFEHLSSMKLKVKKAKDARGHGSDSRGGKRSTTESVFDHHMHMIARDTVRNPLKGTFLGGPSAEEAEHTLRNKFGYGDKDVARLKGTSPEEESYNRELRVRLHNVGPNGRLPPSTIKRIGQFQQRVQKLQEMVASV